jgi:hypothetical protein
MKRKFTEDSMEIIFNPDFEDLQDISSILKENVVAIRYFAKFGTTDSSTGLNIYSFYEDEGKNHLLIFNKKKKKIKYFSSPATEENFWAVIQLINNNNFFTNSRKIYEHEYLNNSLILNTESKTKRNKI